MKSVFAAAGPDNFIVGVRSDRYKNPVIGRYSECGRYPSEVTQAVAMVKLQCQSIRYGQFVIVQFPTVSEMSIREIDVCGNGE